MLLSLGRRKELEKTVSDYVSSKASVFGKDEDWQQNCTNYIINKLTPTPFKTTVCLLNLVSLVRTVGSKFYLLH